MSTSLQPTIEKLVSMKESAAQQATTLKDVSIGKANEILNTHYGSLAIQGVDNTSVLINRLLDHYFPAVENEETVPGYLLLRNESIFTYAHKNVGFFKIISIIADTFGIFGSTCIRR